VPTYQYACKQPACGHRFEAVQSFSDDPITVCPVCEGQVRKVFSAVGVVFKGSGFYRNDSREPAKSGANGSSAKENGAKDGGSKEGGSKDGGSSEKKTESSSSTSSSSSSSSSDSSGSGSTSKSATPSGSSSGSTSKAAAS
jgi:putative FmdB family regulatory protein